MPIQDFNIGNSRYPGSLLNIALNIINQNKIRNMLFSKHISKEILLRVRNATAARM
jgi:hypothetical protein